MTKALRRLSKTLLAVMLVVLAFAASLQITPLKANTDSVNNLDKTNVLDDLRSATINGKPFNILDYPFDSTGVFRSPQIISFIEYCYSPDLTKQNNYALYLYFYNPQGLNIIVDSLSNKVQIATGYEINANNERVPNLYEKFNIKFCNVSEESDYKNLFYKFRIIDRTSEHDGKTILQRVNSNSRRYDISGIELHEKGKPNATEHRVGGTYTFNGYAKDFGPDETAESTLTSVVNKLEAISLEPISTTYRTGINTSKKDTEYDVHSVYFSIDNRIIDEYKKLQKIKAEWWEYKTEPIVVTNNSDLHTALENFIGTDVGDYSSSLNYGIGTGYDFFASSAITTISYDWAFNIHTYETGGLGAMIVSADKKSSKLAWLFKTNLADSIVSGEQLYEYITNYDKGFSSDYIDCNGRPISSDLFADTVDSGRTRGYNNAEIDSDSKFNLIGGELNMAWWEKLQNYGFNWPMSVPSLENVLPIYPVASSDLNQTDNELSRTLLLNKSDISSFKNYYTKETARTIKYPLGKTVYMFRYAITDYYRAPLTVLKNQSKQKGNFGYMAQETMFFDFDILTLTFNKLGEEVVFPVVMSPMDIIPDVTPPPDFFNPGPGMPKVIMWLIIILVIIIIVVIIALLLAYAPGVLTAAGKVIAVACKWVGKIIYYIFYGIVFVLFIMPARGIKALVNQIKENRGKNAKASKLKGRKAKVGKTKRKKGTVKKPKKGKAPAPKVPRLKVFATKVNHPSITATLDKKPKQKKAVNKSRTASGKVPQGRTLSTNDKYLKGSQTGSTKQRPVVVIEANTKNDLAVVPLSSRDGKNRTRLKKHQ